MTQPAIKAYLSIWLILCVAVLTAVRSVTAAQPEPRHETILEQLNDEDYVVRQTASQALLADERLTPQAIEQLYVRATTFEQRHRLMDAARHHLLRQLHKNLLRQFDEGNSDPSMAAIGLRPTGMTADELPTLGRSAVRVERTFPGFPGYAHLQPGDLIIAVNGRSIPSGVGAKQIEDHFIKAQIQRHQTGQRLRLTVVREDRQLEASFRLASLDALGRMYDPNAVDPRKPYRDKWGHLHRKLRALNPRAQSLRVAPPEDANDLTPKN